MKSKSFLLASTALLVGFVAPLAACGQKEKKVYVKEEPQNVDPGNNPGGQNPGYVQMPQVMIQDASNLSAKIKNGKLNIQFQVGQMLAGQQVNILCRHGEADKVNSMSGVPCQGSYNVDNIKPQTTYEFQVLGMAMNQAGAQPQVIERATFGVLNTEGAIIVEGEDRLRNTHIGPVTLTFSTNSDADVYYKCAVTSARANSQIQPVNCDNGSLTLNLNQYQGNHVLTIAAYDSTKSGSEAVIGQKTLNFCGGNSCALQQPGNGNGNGGQVPGPGGQIPGGGGAYPIPGGGAYPAPGGAYPLPADGIFGIPVGVPLAGAMEVSVGRFWTVVLPPRYHLLSFSSNKTILGENKVERTTIIDDPLYPPAFCDPFSSAVIGGVNNGRIITITDGDGIPRAYCQQYFRATDVAELVEEGLEDAINHVEFSSPAADQVTYERFIFSAYDKRDRDYPTFDAQKVTRFESLCAANYNDGAAYLDIINNWWNDPLAPRGVRVKWCQTLIPAQFGAPLSVWVAGFTFEEQRGADNNSAGAIIEMTYVASAAGIPGSFRPDVFLRGTAIRVRSLLGQNGLNAPFNNFNPTWP